MPAATLSNWFNYYIPGVGLVSLPLILGYMLVRRVRDREYVPGFAVYLVMVLSFTALFVGMLAPTLVGAVEAAPSPPANAHQLVPDGASHHAAAAESAL